MSLPTRDGVDRYQHCKCRVPSVGIGIVAYNDPPMLIKCLDAVVATVPPDVSIVVYDDASWAANARAFRKWSKGSNCIMLGGLVNRGSAYGRNQLWEHFERAGISRVATLDMDIRVHPGWLDALMITMNARDDCGIATFRYCNDHGGKYPVAASGQVEETASMCWLVRLAALDDALGPDHVWGMDERMKLLSHDSEMCQRLNRCSCWRVYAMDRNLISEFESSHSTKTACPTINAAMHEQRVLDNRIWGELQDARDWTPKGVHDEDRGCQPGHAPRP